MWSDRNEAEGYDRRHLTLPGLQVTSVVRLVANMCMLVRKRQQSISRSNTQESLALALARMTTTPLVLVLVHGGPLDISTLSADPRFGAILTAWYPAQVPKNSHLAN